MELETDRRRFLELAGTGTALSVAGCNALQSDDEDGTAAGTETTTGGESGGLATVTVAVKPDEQELQERSEEIQSELDDGNISREAADRQYRSAQNELLSDAATSFEDRASSEADLTVEDSIESAGVLLVSGPAIALVDALSLTAVNALFSAETFQQVQSQTGTASETTTSS